MDSECNQDRISVLSTPCHVRMNKQYFACTCFWLMIVLESSSQPKQVENQSSNYNYTMYTTSLQGKQARLGDQDKSVSRPLIFSSPQLLLHQLGSLGLLADHDIVSCLCLQISSILRKQWWSNDVEDRLLYVSCAILCAHSSQPRRERTICEKQQLSSMTTRYFDSSVTKNQLLPPSTVASIQKTFSSFCHMHVIYLEHCISSLLLSTIKYRN